jgi:hypothetical protein
VLRSIDHSTGVSQLLPSYQPTRRCFDEVTTFVTDAPVVRKGFLFDLGFSRQAGRIVNARVYHFDLRI